MTAFLPGETEAETGCLWVAPGAPAPRDCGAEPAAVPLPDRLWQLCTNARVLPRSTPDGTCSEESYWTIELCQMTWSLRRVPCPWASLVRVSPSLPFSPAWDQWHACQLASPIGFMGWQLAWGRRGIKGFWWAPGIPGGMGVCGAQSTRKCVLLSLQII